jgi:hypothetical protein
MIGHHESVDPLSPHIAITAVQGQPDHDMSFNPLPPSLTHITDCLTMLTLTAMSP